VRVGKQERGEQGAVPAAHVQDVRHLPPPVAGEEVGHGRVAPHEGIERRRERRVGVEVLPEAPAEHRGVPGPPGPDGVEQPDERQIRPAHHPLEVEPRPVAARVVVLERPSELRQAVLPRPRPGHDPHRCEVAEEAPQGVRVSGGPAGEVVHPRGARGYVVGEAEGGGHSDGHGGHQVAHGPHLGRRHGLGHVPDASSGPGSSV
jgi:hypothetical protein